MYNYLLNISFRNYVLVIIVPLIFAICLILAGMVKTYDYYDNIAIFDGENFIVDVYLTDINNYYNSDFIIIDSIKYDFELINITDLKVDYYQNYQSIVFKVEKYKNDLLINQTLKITFCSNKETILKKVFKLIF